MCFCQNLISVLKSPQSICFIRPNNESGNSSPLFSHQKLVLGERFVNSIGGQPDQSTNHKYTQVRVLTTNTHTALETSPPLSLSLILPNHSQVSLAVQREMDTLKKKLQVHCEIKGKSDAPFIFDQGQY